MNAPIRALEPVALIEYKPPVDPLAEIKANRKRWTDALRSGKYKQTVGAMWRRIVVDIGKTEDLYCALGVAGCVLGIPSHADDNQALDIELARTRLGLGSDGQAQIQHMNDSARMTFEEIADKIEMIRIWTTP